MPPEMASVRRFLCWLKFCNSLLQESHEIVAVSIANAITEVYLQGKLQDELLQVSELHILKSTALLTALLQHLNSPPLLHQQLLIFILGEEKGPERKSDRSPQLRSQLIQRCNHLSDEISLTTMRLFEEMFQSSDEMALNSLVLRNLENQHYLSGGSEESRVQDVESFEGTEELEEDPYFTDGLPDTGLQMMGRNQGRHGESMGAEQSMRSFLSLVPEEMKSSDSGFDSYLQDALVQHQSCCKLASNWNWPSAPQSLSTSPSGEEFYEGQFLQVLFDRLGGILDQVFCILLFLASTSLADISQLLFKDWCVLNHMRVLWCRSMGLIFNV
ncbi:unnamed protein product [Staurois parvus]|uniref:Uncharacterized protein n=1 Tax=Staurois parvus TaxID=386267 RepID=A0ABN9C850_9NEOB|nr:unnamed protein product [Staurois parvus]